MNNIVKFIVVGCFAILSVLNLSAQKKMTWNVLADYDFEMRFDEESELYFRYPLFSKKVKDLEKQEVYITGYMIPVDVESNYYVLSAYPYANCFFCGGAGAESVLELEMKPGHRRFKTDERLTFKGEFALNAMDIYQLSYQLKGAELYEIPEEEKKKEKERKEKLNK